MKQELLKQYARFAVEVGVNPQSCQTLIINAPVEAADFARTCAEVAYEAGAKQVVVYYLQPLQKRYPEPQRIPHC